ncbi:MAG: fimbria/pilus periplasmic chaperone [Myxococcales bacterium]
MSRSVFSAALLLTLGTAMVAQATAVAIDPTRVHLSGKAHSQSLALHNSGTEKARFQVSAFSWQQSPTGEMQLTPTEDILFFPSLLEMAPGETRKVRVATNVPVETIEKSYRLFVDELPPPNANTSGAVRVLTRLGIPVFVQPNSPQSRPALSAEVRGGRLLVTLENRGNSYLYAQSVRVVGRDASGKVRLEQDLPAWYVLAHGRRAYDVALDAAVCASLAELSVSSKTERGNVRADKTVPAGACAR